MSVLIVGYRKNIDPPPEYYNGVYHYRYFIYSLVYFFRLVQCKNLPRKTYSSICGRLVVPYKYFSIIKLAIDAAARPPCPDDSTYTATAILGFCLGANAIKTECAGFGSFCTVPVLPHTIISFSCARY